MVGNLIKYLLILSLYQQITVQAQPLSKKASFTRADTLRGMLTPLRTCYDINYYHLDIEIDVAKKYINGSNTFRFTATEDFKKLQFDLFQNLKVEKVLYHNKEVPFKREFGAVFLDFPEIIRKGSKEEFIVYYAGYPTIAKNAPWDGGFIFSQDQAGKPWVGVASQGFGASSWWPNKDHQSDEVDSMMISVSVPTGLLNISNGRLQSAEKLGNGLVKYNWFVSYPINNYSVTVNIGDYVNFSDSYQGEKGKLSLDYFVIKENLGKAKKRFPTNVNRMLKCFEYWFGPYPFYRDGYKLIESPYLGMEHQSAIAYGNGYQNGYKGTDLSGTGLGLTWDYIIIHESGHEWFGNNITSKDIADMWIHEAFTMYSEGLFVECMDGKKAGSQYIAGVRKNIKNDIPIIGPYDVNKEGSGDMYYKGANILQTVRAIINNDTTWRKILRGLNKELGLKTTTTREIITFINTKAGKDFSKVFDQYLNYAAIPTFEIKQTEDGNISYKWCANVKYFDMPLRVRTTENGAWKFIYPKTEWQTLKAKTLYIDEENFYIQIKKIDKGATY